MKKTYRIVLAWLLLPLLLAACQLVPPASPTPQGPTMPPANTGMLPPREGDDPLDRWRDKARFKDAQLIMPENAVNYPVLIAEAIELDWETLRSFAMNNSPANAYWKSYAEHFKDNFSENQLYNHPRYLITDDYDVEWGREWAVIEEDGPKYRYHRVTPYGITEDAGQDISNIRYSREEAAELVRKTLFDWGVPIEELELYSVSVFNWTLMNMSEERYFLVFDLAENEPGYTVRFKRALYDIPVFDKEYIHYYDPEDPESSYNWIYGDYAYGIVSDLGLRSLEVCFHRVVEVEKHDVPIMPIERIIEENYDAFPSYLRVDRIELMLVPTYLGDGNPDDPNPIRRCRLMPAWCFTFINHYDYMIVDAQTGIPICPQDARWRPGE